jgi:hypothetical protein
MFIILFNSCLSYGGEGHTYIRLSHINLKVKQLELQNGCVMCVAKRVRICYITYNPKSHYQTVFVCYDVC